jgi:nuclear pore complex protein Nup43
MATENHWKTFIGQKVSKLCWASKRNGDLNPNEFITASWDDTRNSVTQWKIPDESTDEGNNPEPYMTNQIFLNGSITDLALLDSERMVCSTSVGDAVVVSLDDMNDEMRTVFQWEKIHGYGATSECAPCTCIAVSDNTLATGGEDGKINLLQFGSKKPLKTLENADNSNITALRFLNSKEFASINTTGQLKIWDCQAMDNPVKTLTLSGNACPLLSVDKHPNQPHILVTGHGDGVIGIWDIRQDRAPVTLIDAHESEVWQVRFHPLYPDNLFSCSEDGSCWFWNGASMMSGATSMKVLNDTLAGGDSGTTSTSIWLHVDANKHKMETFSLIPFNKSAVNCFDICGSSLLCGTDGEAVIVVNDIPLH